VHVLDNSVFLVIIFH